MLLRVGALLIYMAAVILTVWIPDHFSVEFCFIALCAVLFHKELSDSCGELAKVVGGKDRGAVISAGSLEGTPLERHCKEHRVKSHNRRHSGRKESQEQDRKDIDPDTDKTKISIKI